MRLLRWFSTPLYGVLFAPLYLLARDIALALLSAAFVGVVGGWAARRLLK